MACALSSFLVSLSSTILVYNIKNNIHLVTSSFINIQCVFQEETQVEMFTGQFGHPTKSLQHWKWGKEKEMQSANQWDSSYQSIFRAGKAMAEVTMLQMAGEDNRVWWSRVQWIELRQGNVPHKSLAGCFAMLTSPFSSKLYTKNAICNECHLAEGEGWTRFMLVTR